MTALAEMQALFGVRRAGFVQGEREECDIERRIAVRLR